ncbi:MAG TPA: hypothetical protein VFV07_10025 [Rhizomicrobium sp.]|nr:hypothetical protein [Rhizomicrobium sp.]
MEKKDVLPFTKLMSGVQIAIAHLVNQLDAKGVLVRDEVAQSFRELGSHFLQTKSTKEAGLVLTQIADVVQRTIPYIPPDDPDRLN